MDVVVMFDRRRGERTVGARREKHHAAPRSLGAARGVARGPAFERYAMGGRNAGSRLTTSGASSVREGGVGPNSSTPLSASEEVVDRGKPCTVRHTHRPRQGAGH